MHQQLIYTGIGSRMTPPDKLQIMKNIGYTLAKYKWTLRSGHASGADQAFESGARLAKSKRTEPKLEIYLPWAQFEGATLQDPAFITPDIDCLDTYEEATRIAGEFHPAWKNCSDGAKKLHIRNVYQVAGRDLNTKSTMIICWTPSGELVGGTGQTLRLAEYLQIPIFNLAKHTPEQILNFVNLGELP